MQVKDTLPGSCAAVRHDPEIFQPLLVGHRLANGHAVTDECRILNVHRLQTDDLFFRDDQDVDGRHGVDVPERQTMFILVDNVCGDLSVDDLLEDGTHALLRSVSVDASNQQ